MDLKGVKQGRLEVIEDTGKRKYRSIVWLCRCDCGNYIEITSNSFRSSKKNKLVIGRR